MRKKNSLAVAVADGEMTSETMTSGTIASKTSKKKLHRTHEERRARWSSLCFLLPSILGILVFFVIPFLVIIYYAFIDNPTSARFVFFDNFVRVWNNVSFRLAAKNTLVFSAIAVPLAVILSLLLAGALESNLPGKSKFRTFFLSPMVVPVASVVLIWQVVFDNNGALNGLISLFGGTPVDWLKSKYGLVVIVLLFLWKNLGYNMILFMAAIANIPRDPLEAASVDGAGRLRQFFYIKLRYLSPSILFVTILSLINSFKVFREVYLLTGSYPYESLYMLQHYINNIFEKSFDYQKLAAASLIMFVVMIVIVGILFVVDSVFGKDVE